MIMDFAFFMLFSTVETFAFYYFMFRLFKFDMYYSSIIFTALILSYISYTLREVYHLSSIDVIVQFLLIICFVWLSFKVHLFYASIMTVTALIGYAMVQTFYYLLFYYFGLILKMPDANNLFAYILQIFSSVTILFIGWYLKRKNMGFDFVPHSQYVKVKLTDNIRIILLFCIALVFILASAFLMFSGKNSNIVFISFVLGVVLFGFLFWSYRRDRGDD